MYFTPLVPAHVVCALSFVSHLAAVWLCSILLGRTGRLFWPPLGLITRAMSSRQDSVPLNYQFELVKANVDRPMEISELPVC
jgi:hypothetical protein